MTNSPIGYQGFEDPSHTYFGAGTTEDVPTFYTGAYQVRQFGVGGVSGLPVTVTSALANPPAAMVTAEGKALTTQCVTANDVVRYFPNTDPDLQP